MNFSRFIRCPQERTLFARQHRFRVHSISMLVVMLWWGISHDSASAQSGLRESLERLDVNNNGQLDPDEITPLARPYLERIAQSRRLSLDRPQPIDRLQEASRVYHALQNGVSGKGIELESESRIREFEPDDEDALIPDFGLAEIKYRYNQEDLDEADRTLRRYDRNRDGYIDREEARRSRWTHRDPFAMDLDKDDRLSRMELGQRYARRRMLSGDSDELVQRARRVGNGIESSDPREEGRQDQSAWWRRGGSRYWLSASILSRFDQNRNGRLEAQESKDLSLPVGQIDVDRDGELSREELHNYVSELQDAAGDEAEGIPGWFYELDEDRDEQITMPEFTREWTPDRVTEFNQFDRNGDGLLTAQEVATSKSVMGGEFRNENAEVLPPRKTVISEIVVEEELVIGDLDVQISITHSNTGFLDAYLTGPEGLRIELFTEVGGSGNHFSDTIFDDQSESPINKARAPFEGRFIPEGRLKRQPGLSDFNGRSAKGVWQLVIRGTRSERFGMLHEWALLIRPKESMSGPFDTGSPIAMATERANQDTSTDMLTNRPSGESASAQPDWSKKFSASPKVEKKAWSEDRMERFRQWAAQMKQDGKEITRESKADWLKSQTQDGDSRKREMNNRSAKERYFQKGN